jgi:uncharacterized repeat protein (TIGR03803 family)
MKKSILLFTILISGGIFSSLNAQTQLWGVTSRGGLHNGGVIFKIRNDGSNFQNLYSFDTITGSEPCGHLLLATNGQFYGTAYRGGSFGGGVIFSFNPSNNQYSHIVDFNGGNGAWSEGSLMQASNGKLYGTTDYGGDTANPSYGYGVIFSYDILTNTFADLYHLQNSTGAYPNRENLLEGQNGKLYGLTYSGGAYGYGVIFCYDPSGHSYLDLHDFDSIHGRKPLGGLIKADDGKYYGLTCYGGLNDLGTLFRFDPITNGFDMLYSFDYTTGGNPKSTLMQASDGKLYGMTEWGGLNNLGVIFSYDIVLQNYSDLFDFTNIGCRPYGTFIESTNGLLYGMTSLGLLGADTVGNIFSFDRLSNSISYLHTFHGTDGSYPIGDLTETPLNLGIQYTFLNSVSLYPNPASNLITIETTPPNIKCRLSIMNPNGQELISRQVTEPKTKIDISNLPKGVYFVRLKNEKTMEVGKFIKQ